MTTSLSFIARERELAILEDAYADPSFQFVVLYGRRRVGKTYLLKKFVEDKPNVFFFTGQQTTPAENLSYLSRAIFTQLIASPEDDGAAVHGIPRDLMYLDPGLAASAPTYPDLGSALTALFQHARERSPRLGRPIIVIDEYPQLAKGDSPASSILQTIIDHTKDASDAMLVLCGSSVSFMRKEVLGGESPLFGRRTKEIELRPMSVFDSARVLANSPARSGAEGLPDPQRIVETYGVTGGIPLYLRQFDPGQSTERNLARNLFDQSALLYTEPTSYLSESIVAVDSYNAVLSAIANGSRRPRDIASTTGIAPGSLGSYLRVLDELGIVRNVAPVPRTNGGRPGYTIVDNLFRAWYRLTARYSGAIESGAGDQVAAFVMQQEFPSYVGHVFEDVCRQWVLREMAEGRIPGLLRESGSWWGTDPTAREQADIDVTATTHGDTLVLGECKWRREPMDVEVLRTLERRSSQFDARDKRLFGFSRSGFTEGAEAYARERPYLRLVSLGDLLADSVAR